MVKVILCIFPQKYEDMIKEYTHQIVGREMS